MIVVADSSPLIALITIGHVKILPKLFGQVVIPHAVFSELTHSNRPQAVQAFINSRPAWLIERVPAAVELIHALHAGELEAICLAQELKADLLLMDEAEGRRIATDRHIPVTGTIGVIELAAERGLLDLREAFEGIKRTDFWISHQLLDKRLEIYSTRRKPR